MQTSRAGIPVVALVFPVATTAAGDLAEAVDQFDRPNVLGHLVAELLLDAHTQRCAVRDRQPLAVEPVGPAGPRCRAFLLSASVAEPV